MPQHDIDRDGGQPNLDFLGLMFFCEMMWRHAPMKYVVIAGASEIVSVVFALPLAMQAANDKASGVI